MQKQKKILFLHGFYASGSCVPALALKAAFEREESELASIPEREQPRPKVKVAFEKGGTQRPGESLGGYRATVLTPDLPLHPADAVKLIRDICDQEMPDILVGNSCGSFYAQMISPIIGVPALLGNPHFKMSDFLRERIGNHQYKSPRADGKQDFTIDEQLISDISLTAVIYIIRFAYGASSVRKTRWHTSSHCSWSIITIPFISPVATPQRQSSSRHGTARSLRS